MDIQTFIDTGAGTVLVRTLACDKVYFMTLLETWRQVAYEQQDQAAGEAFWQEYFLQEKSVYEKLLDNYDEAVTGTVADLAKKYDMEVLTFVGFLDGINDSLKEPNPIEDMKEDTKVSLDFDNEKLFRNMVDAKADWLYTLPQWNDIYDSETQKAMVMDQKRSHTFVAEKKIGRNDMCPCGSGKKYKHCCGR